MVTEAQPAADTTFEIDGVTFLLDWSHRKIRRKSTHERFVICKTERHLDFYRRLTPRDTRNIFEIGMYEGGSLVLWDKLFRPDCLVGLDRRARPIEPLEQYRAGRPHIHTYYARGQDAPGAIMAARAHFKKGIDLVIDDASHLYEETRKTFENIFPLVRPGGLYIIEDWAWAHRPDAQQPGHDWHDRKALTNLVFELLVLSAASIVIESIHVDKGLVAIRKGAGTLPKGGLVIDGLLRGKALQPI